MKDDIKTLKNVINQIVKKFGWEEDIAFSQIIDSLDDFLGAQASKYCVAESLKNGCLRIKCNSSTWKMELLIRKDQIMSEINKKLGFNAVKELLIR